jgi:hypothetical protein
MQNAKVESMNRRDINIRSGVRVIPSGFLTINIDKTRVMKINQPTLMAYNKPLNLT